MDNKFNLWLIQFHHTIPNTYEKYNINLSHIPLCQRCIVMQVLPSPTRLTFPAPHLSPALPLTSSHLPSPHPDSPQSPDLPQLTPPHLPSPTPSHSPAQAPTAVAPTAAPVLSQQQPGPRSS